MTPQLPDGAVRATFEQVGARDKVDALPLAQLSVELGHWYLADYHAGPQRLGERFASVAPWARAALQAERDVWPRGRARVSTCLLVDDYSALPGPPGEVIPALVKAARQVDLRIDYLARESACVVADGVALASIVQGCLVTEPPPGTNGGRPPATECGWLANGLRSPVAVAEAMGAQPVWTPPRQTTPDRHSIFVDVELWHDRAGDRDWSCAFLAAVWQLLRLGLIRADGHAAAVPRTVADPLPERWSDLPAVLQLTEAPAPFAAYRALSILPARFLPVEAAVRTILNQVAVDQQVLGQVLHRARDEGLDVPEGTVDRLRYVFI